MKHHASDTKAVIFDLDGTLLDRDSSLALFAGDQYDRMIGRGAGEREAWVQRFLALDEHGYVWKDRVYRQLVDEFRLTCSWETLLDDYMASFRHHCTGYPNLTELLELLRARGLKLAVITNGFTEFQLNNIRALGIEPFFDTIAVSEREGLRKPDPEIFRRTAERLGVAVSESVYVGDHPVNDVAASRQAGMRGIWKVTPYYEGDFARDGEIYDLLEVQAYV